jgi:hypothetical protein
VAWDRPAGRATCEVGVEGVFGTILLDEMSVTALVGILDRGIMYDFCPDFSVGK